MRQLNNIPGLLEDELVEDRFVINDISLHVPPTAISVHKEGLEYSWKTLRSKVSTKVLSGNGVFHVQVNITFAPDSLVLLHRLIVQVRNNPFVMVRNNFLDASIAVSYASRTQNNYYTVFGFNITNHPSAPGAFLVELDLRYFNHKPYGNILAFKKDFVHREVVGNKVRDYVHSVFPKLSGRGPERLIKNEKDLNLTLSSRTTGLGGNIWESLKIVPKNTSGIVSDPNLSNAYKRYCNFIQLKSLKENFGITIGRLIPSSEPDTNNISISDKLYNSIQGTYVVDGKAKPVVGLHELKLDNEINDELIEFRRKLTHAMLLSGLNTRIIVKEYQSLNLDGNFLFRYRKSLHKGTKGKNEADRRKIIADNRRKIIGIFDDTSVEETGRETEKVLIDNNQKIELKVPDEYRRNFTLVLQENEGDRKYYPPGPKVEIEISENNNFKIKNIWNTQTDQVGPDQYFWEGPAVPVFSIIKGIVEYRWDGTIRLRHQKLSPSETSVVYTGVESLSEVRGLLNGQEVPAGTLLGYFNERNLIEIKAPRILMNDICLRLNGKGFDKESTLSSDEYRRAFDSIKKKNKSVYAKRFEKLEYLSEEDRPYIDAIKRIIKEGYWEQYIYRSGLENVFQRARLLTFDSNLFEKDVEAITGIKNIEEFNSDSFPKFEQDITNVSCSLRNIVSSIPILGHEYPTHQFLGSVEPVFQFNFIGKGHGDGLPSKIKELENIRAHTAFMGKNFPQIPDASNIVVESLLTKLVGSFKYKDLDETIYAKANGGEPAILRDSKPRFIISSTDTFTIEGSPGTVGLNFRFSESKPYDEEELRNVVTSDVDDQYLKRYASILRESDIEVNAPSVDNSSQALKGKPIKHSYSTAKYIPFNWNTRFFSASKFYGAAKGHLRNNIKKNGAKNVLGEKGPIIDENAYKFYLNFIDPLQHFLNAYGELQNRNLNISVFSTLDAPHPTKGRKTKSNHFAGVAADIRISNMHVAEAAAIIEMLEERKFFNDVFNTPARGRCLGIGVYGKNAAKDLATFDENGFEALKEIAGVPQWNSESKYMGKSPKRGNGFVHIDANFRITDDSIKSGEHGKLTGRRRWLGSGGDDAFTFVNTGGHFSELYTPAFNWMKEKYPQLFDAEGLMTGGDTIVRYRNKNYTGNELLEKRIKDFEKAEFWGIRNDNGTIVKAIKETIQPDVIAAIQYYLKKSAAEVELEESEESTEEDDLTEGEVATRSNGKVPETREKPKEDFYKIKSTSPKDFIAFLRQEQKKLGITEADINNLIKNNEGKWKLDAWIDGDYNIDIVQEGGQYYIKLPRRQYRNLPDSDDRILKGLERYYRQELLVTDVGSSIDSELKYEPSALGVPAAITYNITDPLYDWAAKKYNRHLRKYATGHPIARLPRTYRGVFRVSKSSLDSKTAQKDQLTKSRLANNTLLKSFTELASVLLTEPYLYTNTKAEFEKEMIFIQDQLHGFPVLPSYYNIIEKMFTGKCTVEAGVLLNDTGIDWKKTIGTSIGSAIALYLAGPTLGVSLGIELLVVGSTLDGDIGVDGKLQMLRVHDGLKWHIKNMEGRESFKEYVKYFKDHKKDILGSNFTLEQAGREEVGKFGKAIGKADNIASSISNYIKPIYTELSVFNTFNKVAKELKGTSAALALIKRSIKENKNLGSEEIDGKLSNYALADRISILSMKEYLQFLFMIPEHIREEDFFVEQDADDIIEFGRLQGVSIMEWTPYLNESTGPKLSESLSHRKARTVSTWGGLSSTKYGPDSLRYVGLDGAAATPIAADGSGFPKITDSKTYPFLFTYQNTKRKDFAGRELDYRKDGITEYFRKRKETLKNQQRVKLAYLRKLLDAILKENFYLNPETVEKSGDSTLLRVLDSATVFELLETNCYPDIDLPSDPRRPFNNSNLSPCFYYHDQNDTLDVLKKHRIENEKAAAQKIINSSIQFQTGLRNGIFTGSEAKLESTQDKSRKKLNKELVDSTEILRTVSDFLVSEGLPTDENDKRFPYYSPINIGLNKNVGAKKVTADTMSTTEIPVAVSSNYNNKAIELIRAGVTDQLGEAQGAILSEKNKETFSLNSGFSELSSMFGSELGFKASEAFAKQAKEINDKKLLRTLGLNAQQSYNTNEILDLCEDSSVEMNRLRTIKEAFPTFRLYIIEEDDIYTDKLTAFDDFFYYNSVISFNFHNSRELASSVATIQLQNISGLLDGSKKSVLRDIDLKESEDELVNEGNFIDTVVLRPGITVQLRAGYESNSNNLDILLSGKITDINYAQNNTICNITIQSFEEELEALKKGNEVKRNPNEPNVFHSTHQLLGSMMMSDELKHFGRSKVGAVFQIGEFKDYSLDLDIYKKESSFTFSLSRGYFDWVRENSFGIAISVGVLTSAIPLLKMARGTQLFKSATNYFSGGMLAKGAGAIGKVTSKIFKYITYPISFVRPFGVNKAAEKALIKQAQSRVVSGSGTVVNTLDDAIEFLIKDGGLNLSAKELAASTAPLLATRLSQTVSGMGGGLSFAGKNHAVYGYINGTVMIVFRAIAKALTGGRVAVGPKMQEAFLRKMILQHKGFTALGLSGIARSKMMKTWLGTELGFNIWLTAGMSIPLGLSIGFSGLATSFFLGGIDLAIDSAMYAWNNALTSFSADKTKLKKKKLLSPKDDNIFAPHPKQYMKNFPEGVPSYWNSLVSGGEILGDEAWLNSTDIINTATFGLINISASNKLKELKLNPFKMIDKRLDINSYENSFVLNGQTIWQILHEMTLRHPGYIYGSRPYGNSLEYRVFFGVPNQRYWSKRITNNEIRKLNKIFDILKDLKEGDKLSIDDIKLTFPSALAQFKEVESNEDSARNFFTKKAYEYYINKTKDRFVPFRQFHFVSSKRNLIGNNIIISSHNMINSVSVNFINTLPVKGTAKDKGAKDANASLLPGLGAYSNQMETLKFRANQNIGMNSLKEKTVSFRNIVGPSNAIRYGIGELLYGARKMYEGSLTILGDTKINPWDVIILHDDVTNMYGPVEVCSVTHMFSFETGFITDVEVNALVTSNEELSHPVITQSLVYETRAKVFDEYNSFYEMGSTAPARKLAVRTIVEKEVEDLIEEEMTKNAGFFREFGGGVSFDLQGVGEEKKNKIIENTTNLVMQTYRDGKPSFLRDFVPGDAVIPSELTNIIEDVGDLGTGVGLTVLGGEILRRNMAKNVGLQIFQGGLWKMGLFFGASIVAANSGPLINSVLSSSYSGGRLGKNIFRKHIMSRLDHGNLIQLYPLVRDGLPMVTGGFEEADETERWNNMLGYIYNDVSSAMRGYQDRLQELKAFGNDVITAYDNDELGSFKSDVLVNLAKLGKTIGVESSQSLLGYMYRDD